MTRIFISYSRSDKHIVDGFMRKLNAAGHELWVDREGIRGGDQWRQEIVEAIDQSDVFLLMLSNNSIASDHVRTEVDLAKEGRKRIIPVDIEQVVIPSTMKYQLAGVQRINMYADQEFGFQNLLETLGHNPTEEILTGDAGMPPGARAPHPQSRLSAGNRWLIIGGVIVLLVMLSAGILIFRGRGSGTAGTGLASAVQGAGMPDESQPSSAETNPVVELEPLLIDANILLAGPEDLERTRGYFAGPDSTYRMLAETVLEMMGGQRFSQPVYLDIVDKHFIQLWGGDYSGQDSLDPNMVQQALVAAHNDYYGDDAETFLELIEGSLASGETDPSQSAETLQTVSATEAPSASQPGEIAALEELTTIEELEPLLQRANIRLSEPVDEERTRGYFTGPDSAYHMLAVAALTVVGDRRFIQPVNLDIVDKWYTQAVGSGYAQRGPLDLEIVKESLVDAYNEYWGNNAASLDELLEPIS